MKKFSKIGKVILQTGFGIGVGYGVYHLYTNSQPHNDLEVETKNVYQPKESIPVLNLNNQQAHQQNRQETVEQKQNIEEKSQPLSNNQNQQIQQIQKNTSHTQNLQNEQIKQSESVKQQPSKSQQLIQSKQTQGQQKNPIDLSLIKRLYQLPEFKAQNYRQSKKILIVADIGFTQQFEQKLLQSIKKIKQLSNEEHIQVFRSDISNPQVKKALKQKFNTSIKDQTIFLMKNQLEDSLISIQFDMYMQFPSVLNTYMTNLKVYNMQNENQYMKNLQKMNQNESFLIYIYDENQSKQQKNKRLLTAKYLQMQLALHHLDNSIKVIPVDKNLAINKILSQDKAKINSIHIIRKHNEFTYANPNLYLKFDQQTIPYHFINDIGFHNKKGEVTIQSYLSKIETFNTLSSHTPYALSLTIDRNRITTENYQTLLDVFKQLKKNNKFPNVGMALKYAQIGYLGKNYPENNQFSIKMANVAQLENQGYLHQIRTIDELKNTGMKEGQWLKKSYEYLYPHQLVNDQLITNFIQKVIHKEHPEYYRSDRPSSLQNVHKIVGSNFNKQIMQNSLDHFVFQFSDHCPACKTISPLISYINELLQPIPVEQSNYLFIFKGFDIHAINCQKNRVKGQMYSPYTPSMNFYKNEWKKDGPVKCPMQYLSGRGLAGLYDFCVITKFLKTIDLKKFNEAIENSKKWNKSDFLL